MQQPKLAIWMGVLMRVWMELLESTIEYVSKTLLGLCMCYVHQVNLWAAVISPPGD